MERLERDGIELTDATMRVVTGLSVYKDQKIGEAQLAAKGRGLVH